MLTKKKREQFGRAGLGCASVLLITGGLLYLLQSVSFYRNYWGGIVFAPLAILVGMAALWLTVFHWKRLCKPLIKDKKGRSINLPTDDYQKW
ncbi:MAG: hypothetical protein EOM20_14745 [Spartobacteria bacterium]|nr:hypothetical protein [Spartobacteria bacterium]